MEDPDKPGPLGWRYLTYDVTSGLFTLWASSYAKINCKMDFTLYPFDTQKCNFLISLIKNSSYQVMFGSFYKFYNELVTLHTFSGISNKNRCQQDLERK